MTSEPGSGPEYEMIDSRLASLEEQVGTLTDQVGLLLQRISTLESQRQEIPVASAHEQRPVGRKELTPGLIEVIKLVSMGQAEESEARLRELPAEELAGNPAVVAIVAAVLCIQRNDYGSALKALNRARQLTDDDRLLKVLSLVEAQLS